MRKLNLAKSDVIVFVCLVLVLVSLPFFKTSVVVAVGFTLFFGVVSWRTRQKPEAPLGEAVKKALAELEDSLMGKALKTEDLEEVRRSLATQLEGLIDVHCKKLCASLQGRAEELQHGLEAQIGEIFHRRGRAIERKVAELISAATIDPAKFERMMDFQVLHGAFPDEQNVVIYLDLARRARLAFKPGNAEWHEQNILVQQLKSLLVYMDPLFNNGSGRAEADLQLARAERDACEGGTDDFDLWAEEVKRLKDLIQKLKAS